VDHIPIIDIAGLRSPDLAQRRAVASALGQACREVGFFYIVNHGVPDAVRAGVFEAARRVFAMPAEDKERVSITLSPENRGYVGFGTERLDEKTAADQKEAFNIGLDLPPDDPEVLAKVPLRGPNLWPDLPGWRAAVLAYFDACDAVLKDIHRGFALDLGVDEQYFADKLDRAASFLRLLHYPAAPQGVGSGELGAGEHTDYGNLTILATDGVAGLQVRRRDGVWIDAPNVEGGFVCNIADCLMRWTNDVYVSTPHRVVQPATERYSVAFFGDANPNALVETLPTCLAPGEAPRYPPITSGEYLLQRLTATYDHLKESAAA
jgi:isopenicillin N synthase-like dioxygenase